MDMLTMYDTLPGPLMAHVSPQPAMIRQHRSGMPRIAIISTPISTTIGLQPWPGRPMAHASLPPAMIKQYKSGTQTALNRRHRYVAEPEQLRIISISCSGSNASRFPEKLDHC